VAVSIVRLITAVSNIYEFSRPVRNINGDANPKPVTNHNVNMFLQRVGFNDVVVVVYRPASCNATQSFFDDFRDLLERLSTLSAPRIFFNLTFGLGSLVIGAL